MVAPLREQHQEFNWSKNIVAVITEDGVINDNLKTQTKN